MKREYPIYVNKKSPCYSKDHFGNSGCPAKNDIPRFLFLLSQKRIKEAFYILKETNPFSGGCGRFCDHPCETACNRAKFDYPVDIKALERFVADWGYKNGLQPINKRADKNKSIAVVGSGPAGLSAAYFLAMKGYKVCVYERHSSAGGLLVEGIPSYRYPRDIFQYELNFIKAAGVDIKVNYNVDKDRFINMADEFDAVIIASGAQKPGMLNIPGEHLLGVENGIEFLKKINFNEIEGLDIKPGESVGVIGGGYTAFDVARSSCRLGLKSTVIYRRSVEEMTAHPGEVLESEKEGVAFSFLRQPISINKVNNRLEVVCQVMKLGPVDESGRSKPIPIKDSFETYSFDKVILAVGDKPDLSFVGNRFTNEYPRLKCPDLPENTRDKIFITGDASAGTGEQTGMVVRAVGSAQKVVKAVMEFLGDDIDREDERDIAYYSTLNTKYFQKSGRLVEESISFKYREGNFNEIVKTTDEDLAVIMAGRCFYCGICVQCDWCYDYSNGSIVKIDKEWEYRKDAFYYHYVKEKIQPASYKSAEACPRSAITIVKDGSKWEKYIDEQYISESELEDK